MTSEKMAYFRAAAAIAELSNHKQYKVGAVVVMNHRIISSGHNSDTKTHPLQKKYNKYRFTEDGNHKQHAEVAALAPLVCHREDLSNAAIYVYRTHANGELACARPCQACIQLIKDSNIKRIFYTTESGYAYEKLNTTK